MHRLALAAAFVALFATFAFAQTAAVKLRTSRDLRVQKTDTSIKSDVLVPATNLKKDAILTLPRRDGRVDPRISELAITYLTKGLAGPRQDPRYAYVYGRVKNIGSFLAYQGVRYEFRQNGTLLKAGTLPEIVPGQEISVSHNFPGLNIPSGPITLRIFAADNQANNAMTITP